MRFALIRYFISVLSLLPKGRLSAIAVLISIDDFVSINQQSWTKELLVFSTVRQTRIMFKATVGSVLPLDLFGPCVSVLAMKFCVVQKVRQRNKVYI